MKAGITVDASGFRKSITRIDITASELLQIEGAGAAVLKNGMRMRVPVDTAATKTSVDSHIIESSNIRVVDDVGPETIYAPNIEYGIQDKPNYPIQPFVRPTAFEDLAKIVSAIGYSFGQFVMGRWAK